MRPQVNKHPPCGSRPLGNLFTTQRGSLLHKGNPSYTKEFLNYYTKEILTTQRGSSLHIGIPYYSKEFLLHKGSLYYGKRSLAKRKVVFQGRLGFPILRIAWAMLGFIYKNIGVPMFFDPSKGLV